MEIHINQPNPIPFAFNEDPRLESSSATPLQADSHAAPAVATARSANSTCQIIMSVIVAIIFAIGVGLPLGLVLTPTTTTTSAPMATPSPSTDMFWTLDSDFNDFYNVYNGIGVNSPAFVSPGYNGYGSALSLNGSSSQYARVSLYQNMTYTSFTWEMWAFPRNLENYDNLMIGMCQSTTFRRCLDLMIRQNSTYFAFYGDDCWSSTIVQINQWHHFAFVYDYPARTQYIYLNGLLTCTHTSSGPFLADTGAITIGAIDSTGTTPSSFWTGYLDDILYAPRAKASSEVLSDATLVAYYSFDSGSMTDLGPNRINGSGVGLTFPTGRVNEGILLNANGDYFQATGFTLLGATYRAYSISLWVYRSSPAQGNGTILHLSVRTSGLGWCIPIIGLSSSYQIIGQSWNQTGSVPVIGPVVPLTTWTHVVHSYSATNGVRLWINGTLIGSTGPFMYAPSGARNTITLGSSLNGTANCAFGNIVKGQFYGMMDELRVYSRELNASEVAVLANP